MKNSHIQWTDHTFNPWIGCTKVSPGCLNCYAEARDQRFDGGKHWGKGAERRRTSASNWREPVKWNAAYERALEFLDDAMAIAPPGSILPPYVDQPKVFCASLADWLDDEVPADWLADLMKLAISCEGLIFQFLTKRPENFKSRILAAASAIGHADPMDIGDRLAAWASGERIPQNFWIGTSAEDQTRADQRIPALLAIPAKVHFLSVEPMLGPIKLSNPVDWVICGGESGPNARPMNPEWARDLLDQCARPDSTPFFMKQMGGNRDKGGELADIPSDLQVREFPA